MNIFSIIGMLLATGVLFIGLKLSSDDLKIFVDEPSLFIVLGATFAATSIAFQLNKVGQLLKIVILKFIRGKGVDHTKVIRNIIKISEAYRAGDSLESLSSQAQDFYLKEGLELLADGVLDREQVFKILHKRYIQMNNLRSEDTKKIKTLGKYPPAFGMMGTTIGMIVLLANLGGADAMKMIGPAMGVCLITTLYGVVLANLVVIPIGDNLDGMTKQVDVKNQIVLSGLKHIADKANPILIAEDLNSYLLPGDGMDWKALSQ